MPRYCPLAALLSRFCPDTNGYLPHTPQAGYALAGCLIPVSRVIIESCGVRGKREGPLLRPYREAGELGFEPRQADPESAVLPLHHSPLIALFSRTYGCFSSPSDFHFHPLLHLLHF